MMNIENLISKNKVVVKGDDETKVNTLVNGGRKFRIVDNDKGRYQIISSDGETFADASSVKGAVIGALVCGVPLREINFNGYYVPVKECLEVVK